MSPGPRDPAEVARLLAVALVPGVAPILEAMVAEEDAYAEAHPEADKEEEEEGATD